MSTGCAPAITKIRHVTAIAGDPQRNLDFNVSPIAGRPAAPAAPRGSCGTFPVA
jgi:hypothetical protein